MELDTLLAQKQALDAQIATAKAAEKVEALAKIKELVTTYELTEKEIAKALTKKEAGARSKVAPKYQLDDKTWTGRGKQPHWVTEALASGLTLEELKIAD